MYQIGETIVYGQTGVCTVEAIGYLPETGKKRLYYTLRPRYMPGMVYVPVEAPVYSRPLLSPTQARDWIARMTEIPEHICPDGRLMAQRQFYSGVFHSHDMALMIGVIKGLYHKEHSKTRNGRPLSVTERQVFRQAEDLVHQELAASLGVEVEQIPQYIRNRLQMSG